jgi:hypothetical protein
MQTRLAFAADDSEKLTIVCFNWESTSSATRVAASRFGRRSMIELESNLVLEHAIFPNRSR